MTYKMIAAPIPPTILQRPSSGGTRNDGAGSNLTAAPDQLSFDSLMAAAASAQRVPVSFMSQSLARTDTPLSQPHADRRSARIATLRQSDADSRAGGGSRISGADRSAIEPAASRISDSTGENADQQRGGNNLADGTRGAPELAARVERLVGSAVRTNVQDHGSSRLSDSASSPPVQTADPRSGSGERPPSDQAGSRPSEPATPPISPAESARTVLSDRSNSSKVAADRVGRVSTVRGSGGSEVRNGPQDASDGVARLRGKDGRPTPQQGVNETRKQNQPRSARMAAYERVSEAIRTMKNGKDWVTRIRLDPPSLGHLRIEVRMTGDTVRVRLSAETADAQRTLTSQLSELRASLEEHGLRLDRIDITTPYRGDATPDQPSPNESSHTPEPHRDVGDGGRRRQNLEANEREGEAMRSSRDEPVLMGDGDEETLVGVGWLDVHA